MGNSFPPLLRTFSTLKSCNFDQIYQLGDSISDIGNLIFEPRGAATPFGSLLYGESFFRNATGHCSNGMLMIDCIAIASSLPFLNPYKKVDADFRHRVNFAVAGATALPVDVLTDWNIPSSVTNSSLNIQLDWMSTYFNSVCHPDCAEKHRSSLFMVGEIGGNDINYALAQGKPIEEVRNMVPVIVRAIKDAVLIYQLGDSMSDTGNLILEPGGAATPCGSLPYGESFFRNATGRCSDGMLMIDYIAIASGLPLLNPYKKVDADFRHEVNFAVAGATALPVDVLANWNTRTSATNSSLNIQLDWMSTYFSSLCHPDCAEKHRSSFFMVGEIGSNDIYFALLQGKPTEEVRNMVPVIVRAIKDAVLRVIHNGAIRIVVPANFPIGCFPASLTLFQTNNTSAYDQHNCLKELNNLSIYQNELLQLAIKELKQQNPNTMILYGDYYNAFQWLYHNAQYFGKFQP
ncbi:hypothetical protein LguiA_026851 [Lonicera macranthoides]